MHGIWQKVRGPFRGVSCANHKWERYDVQRAGCLVCGAAHECMPHLVDNRDCPLIHLCDGEVCCSITGFCLPVVRYSSDEYIDHAAPPPGMVDDRKRLSAASQVDILGDDVQTIVEWFLLGGSSQACKREEVDRTLARCQALIVKAFKQHKLDTAGEATRCLPCLPAIIAQTIHQVHPRNCSRATPDLCSFCVQHITRCLVNLGIHQVTQSKRVSLVVGLLYLMKQGLTIQNVQWLPRAPSLAQCLPHETCLEKTFKLSMKLVCETENEVKLILRQRVKLL